MMSKIFWTIVSFCFLFISIKAAENGGRRVVDVCGEGVLAIEKVLQDYKTQLNDMSKTMTEQAEKIANLQYELSELKKSGNNNGNSRHDFPAEATGTKNVSRKERLLVNGGSNTGAGTKIGFYAYINRIELIAQHKVMVFNVIPTNTAGTYSNHSGIFTAPVSGMFAFSCTLYPHSHSGGLFYMMKNDEIVATMYADSNAPVWYILGSSTTVTLSLNQGDEVFIRSCSQDINTNNGYIEGSKYATSSFAGWLIS